MTTKTITARQRLKIVQKAQMCVVGHHRHVAEQIADSVIAQCGGELTKVHAAFDSHAKQGTPAEKRDPVVQRIKARRRAG